MTLIRTKLNWGIDCPDIIEVKQLLHTRKVRPSCDTYQTVSIASTAITSDHAIPIPFQRLVKNNPLPNISPDHCYLTGLVYGDGSLQGDRVIFNNTDIELMSKFAGTFDCRINGPYLGSRVMQSSVLTSIYGSAISLITCRDSKQLNIELVSTLSLEQFAAFVAGWIDADGFCYEYPGRDSQSLSITDVQWSDKTSELFALFGVVTSVHWIKPTSDHLRSPAVFILRTANEQFWRYLIQYSKKVCHWSEDVIMKKTIRQRTSTERELFTFNYSIDFRTLYVRGV